MLVFATSVTAWAVELSDETLRSAKRIVLIPGTFDPITNGHLEMAKKTMASWNADLAILLPNSNPFHKTASPLEVRVRLIKTVVASEAKIGVSRELDAKLSSSVEEGSTAFDSRLVKRIRELNPDVTIALAVGEDVAEKTTTRFSLGRRTSPDEILIVNRPSAKADSIASVWKGERTSFVEAPSYSISSTTVRNLLHDNFDLYFKSAEERRGEPAYKELLAAMPEAEVREILDSGLYIDRALGGAVSVKQKMRLITARAFRRLASFLGLYEELKSEMVSRVAKPEAVTIEIDGKTYRSIRHLGSGLSADAFLIEKDGVQVVAKVARDTEKSRMALLRSIPIHLWAQKKLKMNVPELVGYEAEGRWLLTSYVPGPTLSAQIESYGPLGAKTRASVLELHQKVKRMLEQSAVKLDFAPDNIIVKDGRAHLVDLGPILLMDTYLPEVERLLGSWEKKYAVDTKLVFSKVPAPRRIMSCEAIF